MKLEQRLVGNTGVSVPAIGFGTSGLGGMPETYGYDVEASQARADLLSHAIYQRAHAIVSQQTADPYTALKTDGGLRSILDSAVYRSVVRHGIADTNRNRSLVVFENLFLHVHPVKVREKAEGGLEARRVASAGGA